MMAKVRIHYGILIATFWMPSVRASDPPTGFRWLDFKRDARVLSQVSRQLDAADYSAIREVGVIGSDALVFTTKRDPAWFTPEADRWSVHNVSLATGKTSELLSGFGLQIVSWLSFRARGPSELGLTYLDCYECEAATVFTSLTYDGTRGWRARWLNKDAKLLPGILLSASDVGEPYTDESVDQIWAVVAPPDAAAVVGTWTRSKNVKTGRVTDETLRYGVDEVTGEERVSRLVGPKAIEWRRALCAGSNAGPRLMGGQNSKICRQAGARP